MPRKRAHLPGKLAATLHECLLKSLSRHIRRKGFGDLARIKQCEARAPTSVGIETAAGFRFFESQRLTRLEW